LHALLKTVSGATQRFEEMSTSKSDIIEIRDDEQQNWDNLEDYLRANMEGLEDTMTVTQFGGGHANLTYCLSFGEKELVVRRPPLGPIAPSAHDMQREHKVLSRLWKAFPLAPRSFLLCTDHDVIGADFHVMERRHGIAIRSDLPEDLKGKPELNHQIGTMVIDTLADFHMVDAKEVGLEDLGKPEGYVERQLGGWSKRWHKSKDQDNADMDRLAEWLADTRPESKHTSLLHNDYKLDNMLLNAGNPAQPEAVLDWDMCTLGDPLTDLGHLLNYWSDADDPKSWQNVTAMPTWNEGFPNRAEIIERYGERTGFDVSNAAWYHAFGVFKMTVIIQQIYIRYVRGQTKDERFASFGERVAELIEKGVSIAKI